MKMPNSMKNKKPKSMKTKMLLVLRPIFFFFFLRNRLSFHIKFHLILYVS